MSETRPEVADLIERLRNFGPHPSETAIRAAGAITRLQSDLTAMTERAEKLKRAKLLAEKSTSVARRRLDQEIVRANELGAELARLKAEAGKGEAVAWRFKHREHDNPWRYSEVEQSLAPQIWAQEPLFLHTAPSRDMDAAVEAACRCEACDSPVEFDLLIPDAAWAKISPKPVEGFKGGGVLCPNCITSRLAALTDAAPLMPSAEGMVLVPERALKWLNGEGPDDNGYWFGDEPPTTGRGQFWWRIVFNRMLAAARPGQTQEGGK